MINILSKILGKKEKAIENKKNFNELSLNDLLYVTGINGGETIKMFLAKEELVDSGKNVRLLLKDESLTVVPFTISFGDFIKTSEYENKFLKIKTFI